MKDELEGEIMKDLVGLRSKMHSHIMIKIMMKEKKG